MNNGKSNISRSVTMVANQNNEEAQETESISKRNLFVFIAVFTCNIAALACGTVLSWSSPILPKLKNDTIIDNPLEYPINDEQESWIGSLAALGAAFGPFPSGLLADKIGRKYTLIILGLPFVVSYLMLAFAKQVVVFYVARALAGFGIGGCFTVIPMFIAEVTENTNRGMFGASFNCFITLGLFFSYSVGPFVEILWFNVVCAIIPALFICLFFVFIPESPHHLVSTRKHSDAHRSLKQLRKTKSNQEIKLELQDITSGIEATQGGSCFELFHKKGLPKALIISLALVFFQQFSGINTVLFYAQTIFEKTGSTLSPSVSPIIIGATLFATSFITPLLVERLGRKILLLFSAIGMVISETALGVYFYLSDQKHDVSSISWLPIVSLILYIVTYNAGFGPLPWTVMAELFPSNVKSTASSMTASFCWLAGFIITKYFSSVSDLIGMGGSFWLFSGFCFLAIVFVVLVVPETKGKSFQEIQDLLQGK